MTVQQPFHENGVFLYHENLEPGLNGFWVEAKDLRVGDVFLDANGELSTLIQTCREEYKDGITVYNFEVAENHNYFIIARDDEYGQTCVLVHNATGYRAVSQAEYDDILNSGRFRQGPPGTSYDGKWFASSEEGAEAFMEKMKNWPNPPSRIAKADVPDDIIERISKGHDGIADSFYVGPDKLELIKLLLWRKKMNLFYIDT